MKYLIEHGYGIDGEIVNSKYFIVDGVKNKYQALFLAVAKISDTTLSDFDTDNMDKLAKASSTESVQDLLDFSCWGGGASWTTFGEREYDNDRQYLVEVVKGVRDTASARKHISSKKLGRTITFNKRKTALKR